MANENDVKTSAVAGPGDAESPAKSPAPVRRMSRPRVGSRISVDGLDAIHHGKVLMFDKGEALISWDSGHETLIDEADLLRPDGSRFDAA